MPWLLYPSNLAWNASYLVEISRQLFHKVTSGMNYWISFHTLLCSILCFLFPQRPAGAVFLPRAVSLFPSSQHINDMNIATKSNKWLKKYFKIHIYVKDWIDSCAIQVFCLASKLLAITVNIVLLTSSLIFLIYH